MTTITTIPLNRLVLGNDNVRRRGAKDGIAELAASIHAHGLRQNLNVKAGDGAETYEVVAGSRRLRALRLLAKEKKLPKDAGVACRVLAESEDAGEISLAENVQRLAMHPMDEFEAFQGLVDKGMPVEDVAARFGVTGTHVQRRLKLAAVSPKLRKLYVAGELSLEQLMAFTVSDDHAAQERVWKELPQWSRDADDIRAGLTGEALRFDSPLVRFVGVEAYTAAGGGVLRDLFDQDNEGYLTDRVLLLQLAGERLDAVVAEVAAEGWKWVKSELERDYGVSYGRVYPVAGEDGGELAYAAEDMAKAGAMVRIGRDGGVEVSRGLVQTEDMVHEVEAVPTRRKAEPGELPAVLVEDLTAHRTAALRIELLRRPGVALAATVHALALSLLYAPSPLRGTCLNITASSEPLERHVRVIGDCAAHAAWYPEAERWLDLLPADPDGLFPWCLAQPQETLLDLLAYMAALTVNAIEMMAGGERTQRMAHTDALARAVELDMVAHWTPSVEGFYGRVSKATLLHIVSEAGASLPVNLSTLKKDEAARYVAKAMEGRAWLPAFMSAERDIALSV